MRNNTEYEPVYRTETICRKVRKRKHAEIIETWRRRSLTDELIMTLYLELVGKGVKLVPHQRVFLKKRADLLDAAPCRKQSFGNELG